MADGPFAEIVRLECALGSLLRDWRTQRVVPGWADVAQTWSAAVWTAAAALGPRELTSLEIERGLDIVQHPVFICGTHRSGTTLLRDLIDGHPQLVVLPSEGTFYTHLERRLSGIGRNERIEHMAQEWLRRLMNPTNQPPFWLLGTTTSQVCPYADFARAVMAWWPVLEGRLQQRDSVWPLATMALAFTTARGGSAIPSGARMWAEKTPTNEQHLDRLRREFPAAKVIQIIRDPAAVLMSHKAIFPGPWRPGQATVDIFRNLARSYKAALEHSRRPSAGWYCLVRYEDLVATPNVIMRQVASFLHIDELPILVRPTVAGLAASRNTSFARSSPRTNRSLSRIDRMCLKLSVGSLAARLGYGSRDR